LLPAAPEAPFGALDPEDDDELDEDTQLAPFFFEGSLPLPLLLPVPAVPAFVFVFDPSEDSRVVDVADAVAPLVSLVLSVSLLLLFDVTWPTARRRRRSRIAFTSLLYSSKATRTLLSTSHRSHSSFVR
jgi:hypothetical protein